MRKRAPSRADWASRRRRAGDPARCLEGRPVLRPIGADLRLEPPIRRVSATEAMILAMDDTKAIGLVLKALRLNVGLSQAQLARRARVTETTIYRHENGSRPPDVGELTNLQRALRCTDEEFRQVYKTLKKFRDRDKEGDLWWKKIDAGTVEADRQAKAERQAAAEIAAAVERGVRVLYRKFNQD